MSFEVTGTQANWGGQLWLQAECQPGIDCFQVFPKAGPVDFGIRTGESITFQENMATWTRIPDEVKVWYHKKRGDSYSDKIQISKITISPKLTNAEWGGGLEYCLSEGETLENGTPKTFPKCA